MARRARLPARGARQTEFADRYRGHPFIHVPDVVPERSAERVLTSEWVDGHALGRVRDRRPRRPQKQQAGRGAVPLRPGLHPPPRRVQRRPAPGQLPLPRRRLGDVPRLRPREALDAGRARALCAGARRHPRPPTRTARRTPWSTRGFLAADHGLTPERCSTTCSAPYVPYLTDVHLHVHCEPADALDKMIDIKVRTADVIRQLNMPPLRHPRPRRVGCERPARQARAAGPWRGILDEYRHGGPPATELGRQEAEWRAGFGRGTGR